MSDGLLGKDTMTDALTNFRIFGNQKIGNQLVYPKAQICVCNLKHTNNVYLLMCRIYPGTLQYFKAVLSVLLKATRGGG